MRIFFVFCHSMWLKIRYNIEEGLLFFKYLFKFVYYRDDDEIWLVFEVKWYIHHLTQRKKVNHHQITQSLQWHDPMVTSQPLWYSYIRAFNWKSNLPNWRWYFQLEVQSCTPLNVFCSKSCQLDKKRQISNLNESTRFVCRNCQDQTYFFSIAS